jgi:hypothetical protein
LGTRVVVAEKANMRSGAGATGNDHSGRIQNITGDIEP